MDKFLKGNLSAYFGTDAEGRSVFWPFGRMGATYLIDPETEKRLVRRLSLILFGGVGAAILIVLTNGIAPPPGQPLEFSPAVRWFPGLILGTNVAFFVQGYAAAQNLTRVRR